MEFDERRRVSKRTFASTPFRVYCVFLVIVALSGGSSKIDAGGQMLVRIASIAVIAFVCFASAPISFRVYRPLFLLLTGATLVVLIQLVPLPPAAWLDLPGRQMYAEAADAAGFSQPWRPWNLVPERGWNALYSLLPPAAALILISTLDRESIRNTIHVWALVALASAIAGLIQIIAGPQNNFHLYSGPDEQSAVGLFANRNHQALLLCCGITMLSAWPSVGKDAYSQRLTLVLATLGTVFMILMVSATGSRAGLIIEAFALVTGALLAAPAVLSFLNVLNSWKKGIVAGVATAMCAGVIYTAMTFQRAQAVQRLVAGDALGDARTRLVPTLWQMIKRFWPVGSGFGSFDLVYQAFEPFSSLAPTRMNQAHDEYLQILMEAGLFGGAMLAAGVSWWLISSIRLWLRPAHRDLILARLGSVLISFALLASWFDYPIRTPLLMIMVVQSACWMMLVQNGGSARQGLYASAR